MPRKWAHEHFLYLVGLEGERAEQIHPLQPTWHHNLSLLEEEVSEFRLEVYRKQHLRDKKQALMELVQVASVAMRAAEALKLLDS